MNSRFLRFAPLVVFLIALFVRLIGLRWGLPMSTRWYSYHPDELQTVSAVANLDFFSGDFNPNFFNYPSAFLYASALVHTVASVFEWTQEITQQNAMWTLPHDILWCARLVSVTLGALTASVVYLLGRELYSVRCGLFAAVICALASGHVQHSHFATVDVAATFWVAMTLWLTARAWNRAANHHKIATRDLCMAGLCAGIGAATKYNAVIVLIAPLLAALWLQNATREYSLSRKVRVALGVFGAGVVGFMLGCPYSFLAPAEFWGDGKNTGFAYELLVHPRQGSGDLFTDTGNGWWYHATFNLPFVLTVPIALASFIGLVYTFSQLITQNSKLKTAIPLLAFALLYFASVGTSQVRFMRYMLPLVPALCVLAALSVQLIRQQWRFPVAAVLVAFAVVGTANVLSPITQNDPRDAALAYLNSQNDTPPISIGLADAQNPLWFTTPPLWPQDTPPGTGRNLGNVPHNPRYDLQPLGVDAVQLIQNRPRYFVWSEFQWRERARLSDENEAKLRRTLNNEYSLQDFHNAVPLALPGRDYVPHDFMYTNPRVEVWTKKE